MDSFKPLGMGDLCHNYLSLAQASFNFFMTNREADRNFVVLPQELYRSFRESLVGGCWRK